MDQGTGKSMSDKPILFSGAMVRAILDGRKVQTRRILKAPRGCPKNWLYTPGGLVDPTMGWWREPEFDRVGWSSALPFLPGDKLWVRETWADVNTENGPAIMFRAGGFHFCTDDAYPVEYDRYPGMKFSMWCGDLARGSPGHAWRPSIFMPRWASRISLDVTDVRVDRLQDITEHDASSEGAFKGKATGRVFNNVTEMRLGGPEWRNAKDWYADLWDTINGAGSWDANPFVIALTFRVVTLDAAV